MKALDLFQKFAAKSGINLADEKNKDFATSIAAMTADIPDEQANKILASLMNVDDAKNNLDLKKHFTAAVFDGGDAEINKVMDEMGFDVADRETVKSSDTFFKKIGTLSRQIKALEAKKNEATGKDKGELQNRINELTTQLSEMPKKFAEEKNQLNQQWEQKFTTTQIRGMLNGKKWANDQIPSDVNIETALVILNRELEKSGAKYVNVNGSLVLRQLADDKLDWMNPSNEKPSFEQFLDGVLASNKLIAVQNAPPPGGGNPPPVVITGGNGSASTNVLSSMQEDLKAAEAAFN